MMIMIMIMMTVAVLVVAVPIASMMVMLINTAIATFTVIVKDHFSTLVALAVQEWDMRRN